jgi:hypothetical protein
MEVISDIGREFFYLSYYLLKKIIAGKGVENNHD